MRRERRVRLLARRQRQIIQPGSTVAKTVKVRRGCPGPATDELQPVPASESLPLKEALPNKILMVL